MTRLLNNLSLVLVSATVFMGCTITACNRPEKSELPTVSQRLAQRDRADAAAGHDARIGEASPTSEHSSADQAVSDGPPAQDRPAVAAVNGVSIDHEAFVTMLIESRGLPLLQQLIMREVALQEAKRRGFAVSPEDVDREYDLTLQAAHFNGKDIENLTPARREQLIEEWTASRGVTRVELDIAMERQAALRRIARDGIEATDEMLRREFDRVHGEKVEVRHLQLPALRVWDQVKARLDRGEDFDNLVADHSQNRLSREHRGLLPPFSADDPTVPAILAEVAFALEPGQVSNPFEAEGSYHVLKLERRIPPDDVTFEDVEDELRGNLLARLIAEHMERMGEQLLGRCRLRIDDKVLLGQYEAHRAAGQIAGPPSAKP